MKIAKLIPLFKNGDPENITNYRPISVFSCFSKVLERIMYNRLYKYLCKEKLLYSKQSGFQKGHSADHAIVHLVDQIYQSFENDNYTLGAFDTVDHSILLKKNRKVRCQYHESCLVCQLLKWQETVYKNY